MPMADRRSEMTHYSQRQHLPGAKHTVPPTAWVRAADVVIAPMIGNIGRLSMLSHARTAPHNNLMPKPISGELSITLPETLAEAVQ